MIENILNYIGIILCITGIIISARVISRDGLKSPYLIIMLLWFTILLGDIKGLIGP